MKLFFALLGMLSLVMASCTNQISYYIPAVVGDGGGLVNVTMALQPGIGNTYVTISPRIGVSTQDSIQSAISYGYRKSNSSELCDVLVSFPDGSRANLIEGPSGGAAFSLMTYALFSNTTIRNDAILTGTIDRFGNVGPVGGLYEKAKGAARLGAKYFITPEENVYETFLLKNAEKEFNITILQVKNLDQLIGFMVYNKPIQKAELGSVLRPIPDLPAYSYPGMEQFRPVASRMIDVENNTISKAAGDTNESRVVKTFFENELVRQKAILDKGYLFSAANEAFLNYIDLSTINVMVNEDVDLARAKAETEACLNGISRPKLTDQNFEWVVGADLRKRWAEDKLANTPLENLLEEEKYATYNELMYAKAWCEVGSGLLSAANENGNNIDESAWKELAEEKLTEANNYEVSGELQSRLNTAQLSYERGLYGAAIYDAVYVISNSQTDEPDPKILNESRSSLWGNIYQSHAVFLSLQNETTSAYTAAKLAKGLDLATNEMKQRMQRSSQSDLDLTKLVLAALALLFLFIVVIIITRRLYGTNGPRYRKTDRTK